MQFIQGLAEWFRESLAESKFYCRPNSVAWDKESLCSCVYFSGLIIYLYCSLSSWSDCFLNRKAYHWTMLTYNFTRDVFSEELSLMGHSESSQQDSIEARISHVWQFTVAGYQPGDIISSTLKADLSGFCGFFFPFWLWCLFILNCSRLQSSKDYPLKMLLVHCRRKCLTIRIPWVWQCTSFTDNMELYRWLSYFQDLYEKS